MNTPKSKRPKSPKTTGDDKLKVFQTEQYRTSAELGQVEQNVAIRWAEVTAICSRRDQIFYEGCTEPNTEPWFLVEGVTLFVRKKGFYCPPEDVELTIVTNGEVFFPVTMVGRSGSRHGEPIAHINCGYRNMDWSLFGPSDKELVQRDHGLLGHSKQVRRRDDIARGVHSTTASI